MSPQVRGSLFLDYVRMLKARHELDWRRHLAPEDHGYLEQRINPAAWYPMATFERLGMAILHEIARGDLGAERAWQGAKATALVVSWRQPRPSARPSGAGSARPPPEPRR